jgi:hypothetical protein
MSFSVTYGGGLAALPGTTVRATSGSCDPPFFLIACIGTAVSGLAQPLGDEQSIPTHVTSVNMPLSALLSQGRLLFAASFTDQECGIRPLAKGTGRPRSDPTQTLAGNRAFNRISTPDANYCAGCHNGLYGIPSGSDFVTSQASLPDRRDIQGANLAVASYQGHTERQSSSGYDPIRQIRNSASRNLTQPEGDLSCQGRCLKRRTWCVDREVQLQQRLGVNAALLDQVSGFDDANGRNHDLKPLRFERIFPGSDFGVCS